MKVILTLDKPTLTHVFEALAALLVFVVIVFQWRESRADQARFEVTVEQQKTIVAQAQEQTAQLQRDIASRDASAQAQISALQSQVAHLATPAQISPWLVDTLNKQVPAPITITVPKSDSVTPVTASIPQADMQSIRDLVAHAQENVQALSACSADRKDLQVEVIEAHTQVKSANAERDAAVKMSKGGGFWRRTARGARYVGMGFAFGLMAAKVL